MGRSVTLQLIDNPVRFTPDGKVAVVDAIAALSEAECPERIWEELKRSHPQLDGLCGDYTFRKEEQVPVAGSEAWLAIESKLLDHLLENAS
ncbi:MAG: hypothetical protein WBG37_07270 [Desulfobacterales bacterium]